MAYPVTTVDGGAAEAGSDAATPANDGARNDGATDDGGAAGAGGAPRTDAAIGGGGGGAAGDAPGPDAAIGAGGTGGVAGVGGQGGNAPVAHAPSSGGCACATVPTGLASRVPLSMLFPLSLFAGAALRRRRRR